MTAAEHLLAREVSDSARVPEVVSQGVVFSTAQPSSGSTFGTESPRDRPVGGILPVVATTRVKLLQKTSSTMVAALPNTGLRRLLGDCQITQRRSWDQAFVRAWNCSFPPH